MNSFSYGKIVFILSYIILEIIIIILIIATLPLLAEFGGNPSIIQELRILMGILSF